MHISDNIDYDDKFFVIDSLNSDSFKSNFYGFAVNDDAIITRDNYETSSKLQGVGTYLLVENDDATITVSQDFNGSYGLYYFKDDDYFAISNSFAKLVEHLKTNYKLSLNREYAQAFLYMNLYAYMYEETLINEIKSVPRDCVVVIDKSSNSIDFRPIDYKEQSVDLNSDEGLKILDDWFLKWVGILRQIKSKTNNITIDLTGGFDTRVIAAIWLNANLDLNKINIRSKLLDVTKEDYEIATQISDEFSFELNRDVLSFNIDRFEDILTPINLSFYTKMGFHKEMYYEFFTSDETYFTITGDGGEIVRGYPNKTPDEYLKTVETNCKNNNYDFYEPTQRIINRSYDRVAEKYGIDRNSKELSAKLYFEVMNRNHYGKSCVEGFFSNRLKITPLIDPDLCRLRLMDDECDDEHLLMALIYLRYCPKLLDFKIEGKRKIDEATVEHARKINEKFPFEMPELDVVSGPEVKIERNFDELPHYDFNDEPKEYIKKVFYSRSFELEFKKYFSTKCYNIIKRRIERKPFDYVTHAYSAMAIVKTINDIKYKNNDCLKDGWLGKFLMDDTVDEACAGENYDIQMLNSKITKLKKENDDLKKQNKKLSNDYEELIKSNSWKMTEPIRKFKHVLKK